MRVSILFALLLVALVAVAAPVFAGAGGRSAAHLKRRVVAAKSAVSERVAQVNTRPIIGIFSLANSDNANETGSIIPAGYVKWLEQAGARVAVIPFNAPHDVLDQLFASINGLLFTGGGLTLGIDTLFFNQALYMFNKAMAANDAGDVFPIWGSCQGFQLMHLLAAQPKVHSDVLKCLIYNSTNLPLSLDFTDAGQHTSSRPASQCSQPA